MYWQPKARSQLKGMIQKFRHENWGSGWNCIVQCPEAQGVEVTKTMRQGGIELEWPPEIIAHQVVLIGTSLIVEPEEGQKALF